MDYRCNNPQGRHIGRIKLNGVIQNEEGFCRSHFVIHREKVIKLNLGTTVSDDLDN